MAATITLWQPAAGEDVARFARDAVAACSPVSPARARSLLWACARLAGFGVALGLDASPQALLRPAVIERFVLCDLAGTTAARRRTVRANLRFVGRRVAPGQFPPDPLAIARDPLKGPYSPTEIAAYLALADAQPTLARRMRTGALICLGAGAGLCGADLREVCGSDVSRRDGVVVVAVRGPRPRVVPVRGRFSERLVAAAGFAGDGFILGGTTATRRNLTNRLISSLAGGSDLARLDPGRLRASWLCEQAAVFGLAELCAAAGLSDSKSLFDAVGRLGVPDEEAVLAAFTSRGAGEPF